jgi:hypothetical protein
MNGDRAPVSRCFMVWLLVSLVCAAVGRLLAGSLSFRAASFDALLPQLAAGALLGCAVWFWWVTSWTAVSAARGATWSVPGCPRGLQRALLGACGIALVGLGSPALADPSTHPGPSTVAGLPLPERASSADLIPTAGPASGSPSIAALHPGDEIVVRPGDTLWALAAASLPPGASDARITAGWHALYAANRDVVPDPDLIYPGTHLDRPNQEES